MRIAPRLVTRAQLRSDAEILGMAAVSTVTATEWVASRLQNQRRADREREPVHPFAERMLDLVKCRGPLLAYLVRNL